MSDFHAKTLKKIKAIQFHPSGKSWNICQSEAPGVE